MNKQRLLKRIMIGSGTALLLLIVIVIVFEVTSTPGFCASCHEIQPKVKTWESSQHRKVSCLKCHAEPGYTGYVKRKLSSYREVYLHFSGQVPSELKAQVDLRPCENCHNGSTNDEAGANIFDVGWKGKTNFSHIQHSSFKKDCLECHAPTGHSPGYKSEYHQICGNCHAVKPVNAVGNDPFGWSFGNNCNKCHQQAPF